MRPEHLAGRACAPPSRSRRRPAGRRCHWRSRDWRRLGRVAGAAQRERPGNPQLRHVGRGNRRVRDARVVQVAVRRGPLIGVADILRRGAGRDGAPKTGRNRRGWARSVTRSASRPSANCNPQLRQAPPGRLNAAHGRIENAAFRPSRARLVGRRPANVSALRRRNLIWAMLLRSSPADHLGSTGCMAGSRAAAVLRRSVRNRVSLQIRGPVSSGTVNSQGLGWPARR